MQLSPGSPPHVRGKAANTGYQTNEVWDHPRVCGEKPDAKQRNRNARGSPPRMRGKDTPIGETGAMSGITPAYAGKSMVTFLLNLASEDHPRVCGEKKVMRGAKDKRMGSPPRMRGKAHRVLQELCCVGITPAYAGKSSNDRAGRRLERDHPRVCGEKTKKIP